MLADMALPIDLTTPMSLMLDFQTETCLSKYPTFNKGFKNSYEQNGIINGEDFAILTSFISDTMSLFALFGPTASVCAVLRLHTEFKYEGRSVSTAPKAMKPWSRYIR